MDGVHVVIVKVSERGGRDRSATADAPVFTSGLYPSYYRGCMLFSCSALWFLATCFYMDKVMVIYLCIWIFAVME